jgi:CHASE3 domain sensor protein
MTGDRVEDDKDDYIDFLHQRIMYLEEELEDSEETVLELKQEMNESEVAFDPIGVIPVSDYLDWLENERKVDSDRVEKLRETLEKHSVVHSGPGKPELSSDRGKRPRRDVRDFVERMKDEVDSNVDDLRDQLTDPEARSEIEDTVEEMNERRREFRERMGLDEEGEEER